MTARLAVHSLATVKGTYAALSYVRGPIDNSAQITLNGHAFAVTPNPLDTLHSLQAIQAELDASVKRRVGVHAAYAGVVSNMCELYQSQGTACVPNGRFTDVEDFVTLRLPRPASYIWRVFWDSILAW
jgi:hypothetical protein